MTERTAGMGIDVPFHGGNIRELARLAGCREEDLVDFSANINPFGTPAGLRAAIGRTIERLPHYPDRDNVALIEAIASAHRCSHESLVVGNGSTELIHALPRALPVTRAVVPVPSYGDYVAASRLAGLAIHTLPMDAHDDFTLDLNRLGDSLRDKDLVFIGQPNNPTGRLTDRTAIVDLAHGAPSSYFIIDESFADFVGGYRSLTEEEAPNLIVVKSLTKFYAIAGVRLGFLHASPPVAKALSTHIPPWTVNSFAQAAGVVCLSDREYAQHTRDGISADRRRQLRRLRAIAGLTVWPGSANFLLLRVDRPGLDGHGVARALLEKRMAVRVCDTFESLDSRYVRVAIRTDEQNRMLAEELASVPGSRRAPRARPRKTPAIMFQGTSSNAGKSVLAAALCRILVQDGVRAAPFKAQNMSLNSFVTVDGGEMGRAQVVQAQACRLAPDVRMNPVLLKPNSDTGSQVIVRGKVVGSMRVAQYVSYKPSAFRAVKECYDSLSRQFDAIVLEGAGSPGEVNLKAHDIVNMAMASHAGSPVLLVGDIDRGGVFASFIGTMETLEQWERELVAGFVVNRFRGDASLLDAAFIYTERHTGKSTLGVIPHISDLGLPEEDSVSFKCGGFGSREDGGRESSIGVIDLPHISNFTDFDAFLLEPDVSLRVIRSAGELEVVDAVILPGSKNVPADMRWLEREGYAPRLRHLAAETDIDIVGICGGYQMLGRRIADPYGLESDRDTLPGLGLLSVTTELGQDKILSRTDATHVVSGLPVSGYEIHHGRSSHEGCTVLFTGDDGAAVGIGTADHRIWGTYLHGVFDKDAFRRWFIDRLRGKRGLAGLGRVVAAYDIESALDRLADTVRGSLDIPSLHRIMGL